MCNNNNDVKFDFSADFEDSNYKSCFARSVVVNSQHHISKSLDLRQLQPHRNIIVNNNCSNGNDVRINKEDSVEKDVQQPVPVLPEINRIKKEESLRRLSTSSITSMPSSRRGSDLPVENLQLQSQVDLLQWQLRQAENSRQMYRAVMREVVSFLERAHRSLDFLCEKQTTGVPRSRSEYHVAEIQPDEKEENKHENYSSFRDFTWRRPKRQPTSPNELPPDKLSQEAFRLLRTAQSLLNTREPDLAHVSTDQEFLSQIAKEFPSKPQRTTSFSLNPQLINPSDREVRISTALNRKLSLQRTPSLRQTVEIDREKRNSIASIKTSEKTTGSVSSAEDESGFSSMNSFQEVGLPIIHNDSESAENLCDISVNSSDSNITQINLNSDLLQPNHLEKSKLIWNRSEFVLPLNHRRWSSTPVEMIQNDPLKVLWV